MMVMRSSDTSKYRRGQPYTKRSKGVDGTIVAIDEAKTEEYVSKMVTEKELFARINRMDGIIRFRRKQTANEMLNEWKADTDKLLDLVDLTCHQIHKEMVIHKSKGKGKGKGKKGKSKK